MSFLFHINIAVEFVVLVVVVLCFAKITNCACDVQRPQPTRVELALSRCNRVPSLLPRVLSLSRTVNPPRPP